MIFFLFFLLSNTKNYQLREWKFFKNISLVSRNFGVLFDSHGASDTLFLLAKAITSTKRYKQIWYKQQVHVHNTLHLTFSLRMTIVKEKCDKNKNIANLTHELTATSKIKTAQQNKMSNKLYFYHSHSVRFYIKTEMYYPSSFRALPSLLKK